MSPIVKEVKTRNQTKCDACGSIINKGSISYVLTYIDNLHFQTSRFCSRECYRRR